MDWRNQKLVFENGLILNFPNHVDGGGYTLKDEIFSLIERTGTKDHYTIALDWCAGYGPFGFDLLDKNKADHVSFVDCYDVAIETCINNAKANNLEHKIAGYVSDKISSVPFGDTKFDLVVANPPHSSTSAHIDSASITTLRMIVDEDYIAHQEFYANIRKFLTDDADVYITAGSNMEYFIKWAALGGLILQGFSPSMILQNGGIYHFKPR
jgi:methylase of polypeptide subunit release factors